MRAQSQLDCPECRNHLDPTEDLDRRDFIRTISERTTAVLALGGTAAVTPTLFAADEKKTPANDKPAKPAEALVRELAAGLTADQRKQVLLPYDHGARQGLATRMRMYNSPIAGKMIGKHYTKPQQELLQRILRAICSDEEGYRRISRNGTFDASGAFENCGALIFGDPSDDKPFAWVFTGHHLTVRCDGNFSDGAAFGGPMYYGHSPDGYSDENVFHYQTKSVLSVYESLSDVQRKKAVVRGTPGEHEGSIKLRAEGDSKPGIGIGALTPDQRELVEKVMRDVLSPYRKEDADEVMQVIKATGGMEKVHLAFYQDRETDDAQRWHFWRLEGPGFVWNYRVLPHVHTYVNIGTRM
jgi:hypothetical protein